jgi:quercetin dioxygenase-like cupin family protein/DNA-binding XRE family transcriptional regulator
VARPRTSGNGSSPEYAAIGARLRAARGAKGQSLRVLATKLGVSPSLISQVETGRAKPSVSTLYAIATELGISLDELLFTDSPGAAERVAADGTDQTGSGSTSVFRAGDQGSPTSPPFPVGPMPSDPVQPAATRKHIRLASGVVWERLTTASVPNSDFLYVTYEVGGASTHEHEFQRHSGQEWGYILSGTLGVTIGFDEYILGPGDAISFDSNTPHRMRNLGHEPVHGIWFTLGRGSVNLGGRSDD